MYKSLFIIITLCTIACIKAQGQTDTVVLFSKTDSLFFFDTDLPDKFYAFRKLSTERDLDDQMIPLTEIIAIAVKNHPLLSFQQENIRSSEFLLEATRRQWQQNVVGNVSYFQGANNLVSTLPEEGTRTSIFGNGLRYGVSVNIPLSEFSARKSRVKQHEHLVMAQSYKKEELEQAVTSEVIKAYTRLISAQRLLKIQTRGREEGSMQLSNAELEFKSGDVTVSEYARVAEVAKKAEVDFEFARREFFDAYYQFELLVGEKN